MCVWTGAACAQGRRWPEVRTHLEPFWSMTLRCADDIKESVRAAATGALRALRGLTLRLCDPAATPPADAAAAVALALPLLLQNGAHPAHACLFERTLLKGARGSRAGVQGTAFFLQGGCQCCTA